MIYGGAVLDATLRALVLPLDSVARRFQIPRKRDGAALRVRTQGAPLLQIKVH